MRWGSWCWQGVLRVQPEIGTHLLSCLGLGGLRSLQRVTSLTSRSVPTPSCGEAGGLFSSGCGAGTSSRPEVSLGGATPLCGEERHSQYGCGDSSALVDGVYTCRASFSGV